MKYVLLAFTLVVASAATVVAQDNNIADFIQAKYCNDNGNNGGNTATLAAKSNIPARTRADKVRSFGV